MYLLGLHSLLLAIGWAIATPTITTIPLSGAMGENCLTCVNNQCYSNCGIKCTDDGCITSNGEPLKPLTAAQQQQMNRTLNSVGNTVSQVMTSVGNDVGGTLSEVSNSVSDIMSNLGGGLKGLGKQIDDTIHDVLSGFGL